MKKERVSSGSFFLVSRFFFALKKNSFFVSSSVRWLKKKGNAESLRRVTRRADAGAVGRFYLVLGVSFD